MSVTRTIRPPAVAGYFYPNDPGVLADDVEGYLAVASDHGLEPAAIIAPHAGYRFSGAVAATAYAGLRRLRGRVRRVVLVGPAHRVAFDGVALPRADAFETPLGWVPVDGDIRSRISSLPFVTVSDAPHAPEHSIEVHLPFLQRVLGEFTLVPIAVGSAAPDDVADVIERSWAGSGTLVVVSSDLSHYHDEATARRLDDRTCRAIEALRPEVLRRDSACGVIGVAGLLLAARRRGMRVVTLDVRTSADTAGSPERVVGYGSWAFVDDPPRMLSEEQGSRLLELAKATVAYGLRGGVTGGVRSDLFPARLKRRQAVFVTLMQGSRLRGCIGGVEPVFPLAVAVARAAHRAAFGDARFSALRPDEAGATALSVSVLSSLERTWASGDDELARSLRPGADGLVLADGWGRRGVFLPDVWEACSDPIEFVARLRRKAGLEGDDWTPTTAAYRFETQRFS